jgi:5,10-methylenetetrahydromethanopterin reductase
VRIALRLHGGLSARASVEQAGAAERAGLSAVWFAENPFNRGVLPAMAACALATSAIRIGIGVFNPFNRHPTLIAMEMGALDELSGGRAMLGIGAGIKVAQIGLPCERPIAAVRDAIQIVRPLLRGEEVDYAGKVFSAAKVRLEFPPCRASMPILMAAVGDQALGLCGEIADGLLISNMCPPAYTRRAVGMVAGAARRAGRPRVSAVVQYAPCAIEDDGAEARRIAKGLVGAMLVAFWRGGRALPATQSALRDYNGVEAEEFGRIMDRLARGEPAETVLDDRLLTHYAVAGTPAQCLGRFDAYREAGVTELALWFAPDRGLESIERLGRALQTHGLATMKGIASPDLGGEC